MTKSPAKALFDQGFYKYVDGHLHKLCSGPAHDEPTYLPANDKYFYRRESNGRHGELTSRCRLCSNWEKMKVKDQMVGWVPLREARPFFLEAANRIGAAELHRRTGVAKNTISNVMLGRGNFVQRRTLRKVMLELVSIKRKNEYSINKYSAWRVTKRAGGERCSACEIPTEFYTEGCRVCMWRRNGREKRALLTTG